MNRDLRDMILESLVDFVIGGLSGLIIYWVTHDSNLAYASFIIIMMLRSR